MKDNHIYSSAITWSDIRTMESKLESECGFNKEGNLFTQLNFTDYLDIINGDSRKYVSQSHLCLIKQEVNSVVLSTKMIYSCHNLSDRIPILSLSNNCIDVNIVNSVPSWLLWPQECVNHTKTAIHKLSLQIFSELANLSLRVILTY